MKKIDHYLSQTVSKQQTNEENLSDNESVKSLTSRHIDTIWLRMGEIYGHKWTSSHGDCDASDTWLKGLQGLTPEQLATGLTKCLTRTDTWPPSLPEFRGLCLPSAEDLGLPEAREAYMMAVSSNWAHPAILHAAQQVGTYELKTQAESKTWPLFRTAYKHTVDKVIAGQFVEPEKVAERIEQTGGVISRPTSKKQAFENIKKLREAIK